MQGPIRQSREPKRNGGLKGSPPRILSGWGQDGETLRLVVGCRYVPNPCACRHPAGWGFPWLQGCCSWPPAVPPHRDRHRAVCCRCGQSPSAWGTSTTSIDTVSSLEALDLVQLSAQASGRIERVLVGQGSQVRQGDLLLVLDQEQQRADAISLRAKAASDQLNYQRYESLARQGAVSPIQRDQFRQESNASREALIAREADRRFRNLCAPISGTIADLRVKQGDVIASGDPFTKLVRNDRLMVRVEVPTVYAERVRPGQTVLISDPATDRPLARGQGAVARSDRERGESIASGQG
ncbi:efflux RND transporter periplasmic adaptor subunit [Cyanobium sp. Morenito 9A2]|uniref:efflux RND transporter periplasmic adaptor subunit n=1 Tax=Cyanobium sp. Morenito 9A2 TaxID=2823718 RepID=UPI0020CE32C5|nr:efflux RND transporter periplasmic adaptor subunit [Cyanobium sp. Morenito 9A2]